MTKNEKKKKYFAEREKVSQCIFQWSEHCKSEYFPQPRLSSGLLWKKWQKMTKVEVKNDKKWKKKEIFCRKRKSFTMHFPVIWTL